MTDLFDTPATPPWFSSPRQCLQPILNNARAWNWATQLFDPKHTPIDTALLSLAIQHHPHANIFKINDTTHVQVHDVLLPVYIDPDDGFACAVHRESTIHINTSLLHTAFHTALHTTPTVHVSRRPRKFKVKVLSRTVVVTLKYSNMVWDFTHYEDSTVTLRCGFDASDGTQHAYRFRLQKNSNGDINVDHPFKARYEITAPQHNYISDPHAHPASLQLHLNAPGKPYHSYINFIASRCIQTSPPSQSTFTTTYVYVGSPIKHTSSSSLRWLQTFRGNNPLMSRKHHRHWHRQGQALVDPTAALPIVTRVAVWDYIGPRILAQCIPIDADLIRDNWHPLNSVHAPSTPREIHDEQLSHSPSHSLSHSHSHSHSHSQDQDDCIPSMNVSASMIRPTDVQYLLCNGGPSYSPTKDLLDQVSNMPVNVGYVQVPLSITHTLLPNFIHPQTEPPFHYLEHQLKKDRVGDPSYTQHPLSIKHTHLTNIIQPKIDSSYPNFDQHVNIPMPIDPTHTQPPLPLNHTHLSNVIPPKTNTTNPFPKQQQVMNEGSIETHYGQVPVPKRQKLVSKMDKLEQVTNNMPIDPVYPQHKQAQSSKNKSQNISPITLNNNAVQMHECSYCGKLLSSKGNMVKHIKTVHEKVRRKVCDICGQKFHQIFNLQRHMQRIHPSDPNSKK